MVKENQMLDPTIMAWHKGSAQRMPALYDGAYPETSWAKCGAGNGGKLEVNVGNDHQFIMMDTGGYEKLGEMPLRKLSDRQGNE
ncbi:AF1514 family protein [Acidithiobacillus sp.]|uniref:AF1514 family protein n=1 Tax=Acidithiobacillus sp. TaxID=1872118 RepID=UPI0031FE588D